MTASQQDRRLGVTPVTANMGACCSLPRQDGASKHARRPAFRAFRLPKLFRLRKSQTDGAEMAERITDEFHKRFMREAIKMVRAVNHWRTVGSPT